MVTESIRKKVIISWVSFLVYVRNKVDKPFDHCNWMVGLCYKKISWLSP